MPLSWIAFILISKELAETHVSSGQSSSKGLRTIKSSKGSSKESSYGGGLMSAQSSFGNTRGPAPPSEPAIEPPTDDPMEKHI